jgi:hypothetical protein
MKRAHLAAIGFAITRARSFTRSGAPKLAEEGVTAAEDALQVLVAQLDQARGSDAVAIAALDRVRGYVKANHPHGVDATIAELDIARQILAARH